jgi:hypothetical protein
MFMGNSCRVSNEVSAGSYEPSVARHRCYSLA